ncbi:hypothetical protein B0O95_110115 [Mycetohabitans endofungorum]|uniref:Uncharacterized protein n=1 Tax=Mycetohabitans endofungorum TaxID=417203 RepID=A0A2P5K8W3_9BURK|nr:hypothetical protein B0O95_110115 [Mycetohabitans endofungorum]
MLAAGKGEPPAAMSNDRGWTTGTACCSVIHETRCIVAGHLCMR